ncbi:semaphorin-7A isoform X2 [Narcine bancroftii]|uniref:semaphorin-7A isoform X2 n=1 Tax=Narcine bancroftii TaxID=1343680 RepID=UPI003831062B
MMEIPPCFIAMFMNRQWGPSFHLDIEVSEKFQGSHQVASKNFHLSPAVGTVLFQSTLVLDGVHLIGNSGTNLRPAGGDQALTIQQFNEMNLFINRRNRVLGPGTCPEMPQHDFASLVVDERLYSVVPDDRDKMYLTGYRKGDFPARLNSEDKWMEDPRFVTMSPLDDLIYMFFRERNELKNQDTDPWISRIARVCKSDKGGSRQRLLSKWTTFLKARLICGMLSDSIHFNRIQDAFISKDPNDSEDTRVYGIFHSNWNGTAVCVYSMKEIDGIFANPSFKGYSSIIPTKPRPGKCVPDTSKLPDEVLALMENYPTVDTWIQSIGRIPLMTNHQNHFTKVVVDSVVDLHGVVSRVLYLAMGDGKIQKVLERKGSSTFIIAELTISKENEPILSMSLDSNRKILYITTAKELVRLPLVQCEKYDGTCGRCIQARDPYCGWDYKKQKCVPISSNSKNIWQDLERGDACSSAQMAHLHSSARMITINSTLLRLPMKEDISVYLSCPKQSYHADYLWRFNHNHEVLPCSVNDDHCLLFISKLSQSNTGHYECISNERGVEHLHADYFIENNGGLSANLSSVALVITVIYHLLR